jgi:preprotein translocase subunit SecE
MDLADSITNAALCILVDGSLPSIFYTEAGGSRLILNICIYIHVMFQKTVTPIITALATSSLTIHIVPEVAFVVKVKTTCWNLYQQTCHRQNRPVELKKDNVEQQLMYIKYTIQELGKIVHTARQHTRKEVASNVATCTTDQK